MPKAQPSFENLSPFSRSVLELYSTALADVRFPDLDLASLRELAGQVRDAQHDVDDLEAQLRHANERVAEQNAALQVRAERALSYARIYAEGNAELTAQIAAIQGAPTSDSSAPKRRGRARRPPEGQLDVLSPRELDEAAE
jgi:hypothetical protein